MGQTRARTRGQPTGKEPVLVRWLDIMSWPGWNEQLIEEGKDEPAEFLTLGYIVNDTPDKLTISDTENAIGNVTTFPRGCVLEVIPLKRKNGEPNAKKGRKTVARKRANNE